MSHKQPLEYLLDIFEMVDVLDKKEDDEVEFPDQERLDSRDDIFDQEEK